MLFYIGTYWSLFIIFLNNLYITTNGLNEVSRIKYFDNEKGYNYPYLKISKKYKNQSSRRKVIVERLRLLRRHLLSQNRFPLKKKSIIQQNNLVPETNFDVEKFKRVFVIKHNLIRIKHHVQSLGISKELENEAQRYADKLASINNGLRHDRNNIHHGENLYYGTFRELPKEEDLSESILDKFYTEIKYYNYKSFNPQDHHKYGHFTQMIWKSTTEIGVGVEFAKKYIHKGLTKTRIYVVVRYNPEGNILSEKEFRKNVL
ncbi:CAP domain-containing protein [Strongyloides ratti]|uniref:CAP domain-containing protein n=1 Tax=Strongyloides ratti TaxID=34506 RepID=A0A090LET8_STRRB|nr:CAP domain-containing protein [Strongyloides ratti]CEF68252.1 CAP domain-containing protein [Strongyloides ratti]